LCPAAACPQSHRQQCRQARIMRRASCGTHRNEESTKPGLAAGGALARPLRRGFACAAAWGDASCSASCDAAAPSSVMVGLRARVELKGLHAQGRGSASGSVPRNRSARPRTVRACAGWPRPGSCPSGVWLNPRGNLGRGERMLKCRGREKDENARGVWWRSVQSRAPSSCENVTSALTETGVTLNTRGPAGSPSRPLQRTDSAGVRLQCALRCSGVNESRGCSALVSEGRPAASPAAVVSRHRRRSG
jgi:hypothetical protein